MNPFVIVPTFIGISFVIVLGTIAYQLVIGLAEWSRNNALARISVPARVTSRRTEIRGRGSSHAKVRVWTMYFATFELESGERIELGLNGKDYGLLAEGDRGILAHQGTRYLGFQRRV